MRVTLLLFVLLLTESVVVTAQTKTIRIPLKFINESLAPSSEELAQLPFDKNQIVVKTPSNLLVKIERLDNSKDHFKIAFDKNDDGNFSEVESFDLTGNSKLSITQQIKNKLGKVHNFDYEISFRRNEQRNYHAFYIRSKYSLTGEFKDKNCKTSIYLFDQNADSFFTQEEWTSNFGADKDGDGRVWGKGEWAFSTEIFELCRKNYLLKTLAKDGSFITLSQTKLQNVRLFQESPKFNFTLVNKRTLSSETLKGKPFLIDFWATWCGPCVAKLPEIKQIEGTIPIIYFNTDTISRKNDALKLIDKLNIKENSVLRTSPKADYFYKSYQRLESGLPFYVLIDANGIIRYAGNGGEDLIELKNRISELTKSK